MAACEDGVPPRDLRGVFGLTISGLFTSAMITVATLAPIRQARNSTTQIHGLSYSHFRMPRPSRSGAAQGPRKRTTMSWVMPPMESVTVNANSCDSV